MTRASIASLFAVSTLTLATLGTSVVLAGCDDATKGKEQATVASAVPVPALPSAMPAASGSASGAGSAMAATGVIKTYKFDDTTSKIQFTGSKITGHHDGVFEKFTGQILLVDNAIEKSRVIVDVDLSSAKTDQDKLNGHLKSKDFFDVATFAKANFTSTSIVPAPASATGGATDTITGNLDLHGIKKSISFPAKITVAGDTVTATSEFTINRKDFGIVYPGKVDDLIKDDVVIKLDIKATKS